jgi:hypothetical protein
MAFLKYRTLKLYDVTCDNPVLGYDVDPADNVVTNDAPRYTLICDILSVFVHDNETDVPVAVNASDVGTVVGPSKAVILRPRPNPLADPPPNVVKNGDIVYLTLVCTANILNIAFAGLIGVYAEITPCGVQILPLRINCPDNRVLAISSFRCKGFTINILICCDPRICLLTVSI